MSRAHEQASAGIDILTSIPGDQLADLAAEATVASGLNYARQYGLVSIKRRSARLIELVVGGQDMQHRPVLEFHIEITALRSGTSISCGIDSYTLVTQSASAPGSASIAAYESYLEFLRNFAQHILSYDTHAKITGRNAPELDAEFGDRESRAPGDENSSSAYGRHTAVTAEPPVGSSAGPRAPIPSAPWTTVHEESPRQVPGNQGTPPVPLPSAAQLPPVPLPNIGGVARDFGLPPVPLPPSEQIQPVPLPPVPLPQNSPPPPVPLPPSEQIPSGATPDLPPVPIAPYVPAQTPVAPVVATPMTAPPIPASYRSLNSALSTSETPIVTGPVAAQAAGDADGEGRKAAVRPRPATVSDPVLPPYVPNVAQPSGASSVPKSNPPQPVSAPSLQSEDPDTDVTVLSGSRAAAPIYRFTTAAGQIHQLARGAYILGRRPSRGGGMVGELITLDDASRTMSKNHAILDVSADRIVITDIGSTNGTRILREGTQDAAFEAEPHVSFEISSDTYVQFGDLTVHVERL